MSSIRRINCENCSAPYAINVATLRKEKNTVTCRRCKHKMIVYKSGFSEPADEHARVVQDDEKTLIDDEPKIQQDMPVLDTEVSTKPPPLSLTPKIQPTNTEDRFDQTARPEDFVPLHSRQNLREELADDSTAPRPRHNISPRDARAKPEIKNKKNVEKKFTKASPSSSQKTTKSPAGLSLSLAAVAGMISMAMLSSFGQYYLQDEVGQKISLIVSISSLMLAFFLVVTSSFGKKSSSMIISLGLSALTTVALGAGLFMVGINTNENNNEPEKEVKENLVAQNEKKENPEQEEPSEEKGNEEKNSETKKTTSSNKNNSNSSSKKSNKSSRFVAEAVNPRIEAPEPSMELPEEEDKKAIIDPLDEEMSEPDMDLGDMDLDLDAEEEKKSRFVRKEKEKKPEPKVEAVKKETTKAAPKVEIPQSVMDIIIRNNKDVKGCYVSHRAEHGDFPKKVEVLFTLQPSGKVSQAYIAEGPHVGSKFESCLRAAFKKMTFPAFDSAASPQSLRYTLKI